MYTNLKFYRSFVNCSRDGARWLIYVCIINEKQGRCNYSISLPGANRFFNYQSAVRLRRRTRRTAM